MNVRDSLTLYRLRRGDRNTFEAVVKEQYQSVYKQLWYLCNGDAETAADLTQETFVQAWRALPSFAGRSSLRTWLHTIAVRTWGLRCRRMGKEADLLVFDDGAHERLPHPARSPEAQIAARLSDESLYCALQKLPPPLREVVVLFYLDNLKYREIAVALEIPIGTVKSRLHAALKQIRAHLEVTESAREGLRK